MKKIGSVFSAFFLLASLKSFAAVYPVPSESESLIGENQMTFSTSSDTVMSIMKHYDIGFNALSHANPHLDMTQPLPYHAPLQIPTKHLLPNEERKGIVINLPEMRMYYFVDGTDEVLTYPIGIGKIGKTIPITKTAITRKKKDPAWIPPQDIREFNLAQGIVLPRIMPPGPDNPLGQYAIYMKVPTYLIHSTPFTDSVGKRASFGCIRMYETDIQDFFPTITSGIPVSITNRPVKVGWQNSQLYMEAHDPLEEHNGAFDASLPGMVHLITETTHDQPTLIDWQKVSYLSEERDGMPHDIGVKLENR